MKMKTTITRNFDFNRLLGHIDDIMARQPQKMAKESAKSIRERILKGLKPPLKKSTMRVRKMRGIAGATPLLATGALYKSIKDTKEGLKMLEYGTFHHKGFTPKNIPFTQTLRKEHYRLVPNKKGIKVPARPFIFPGAKDAFNITKTLIKDMNRALQSGGAQRP